MLGIAIPAHNEQDTILECVRAVVSAARNERLNGEPFVVTVVADSCTDQTQRLAELAGAQVVVLHARNVGAARAIGASVLLAHGCRWLAFTDADTLVSEDWLVEQLSLGADAVCGTVGVDDWTWHGDHASFLQDHFRTTYMDREDHAHIHGANLGVSAVAYQKAGGFKALACSEDVDLVHALVASGAHIAWSAKPRVITSSRVVARAKGGFADALILAVTEHLANPPLALVGQSAAPALLQTGVSEQPQRPALELLQDSLSLGNVATDAVRIVSALPGALSTSYAET